METTLKFHSTPRALFGVSKKWKPQDDRWIIHVDMDAYFASVEQAHRPHLRDKPVIVTADPYGNPKGRRSVVAAASYEAKQSGVKSGMPLFEALKLCPQAFLVEGNADKYQTLTCQLISILSRFSHQIEVYSIDEAFLDVTQTHHLFSGAAKVGEVIRALVKKKLNITCSIGVAPNKLVAKVASSLRKPDALVVVAPDDLPEMLWPLPVDRIPGVGPRRKLKLKIMSIKTVGEIAYFPLSLLRSNFGSWGEVYIQCSLGKRRHSCNFSDSSIQIYRAFHYFKRKPSSARRSSSCPSLPC